LKRALRSAITTIFKSAVKGRVRTATMIATSVLLSVRVGRIASNWKHPKRQRVLPAATALTHLRLQLLHPPPAATPGMLLK